MKPKSVELHDAAYDAASVAAFKTFDEFKADADAQTKANDSAHWGHWPADKRDENLRAVYDQSVDLIRPKPAPAAKEPKTDK